jgi:hypothetical protein
MGNTTTLKTSEAITAEEFQDALTRYDQVVEAISASKGCKLDHDKTPYTRLRELMNPQRNPGKRV